LALREGDRLGSGARKTSWRLEELKERIVKQLNQPMSVTDLAIDGNDLMEELNIEPSPILGKILNALLEKVLENPDLNTREKLLTEAKKIFSKL
jgi:poly(A) polymerase/tRNA nucleotidyltransferase (CCA-adding enzyme)